MLLLELEGGSREMSSNDTNLLDKQIYKKEKVLTPEQSEKDTEDTEEEAKEYNVFLNGGVEF